MKGTQRRVVYLKNTGSSMFDEAYFIIKENAQQGASKNDGDDLIREANRIIDEHIGHRKKSTENIFLKEITAFVMGAFITLIIMLIML